MENASKALIIAGAILISILLISVGVLIMGGADGMTDTMSTTMSQQEIDAFNQPFLTYENQNQTANNVKALIGKVVSSNKTHEAKSNQDERFIEIELTCGSDQLSFAGGASGDTMRSKITSTKRYTVECKIDSAAANKNTGLIDKIVIKQK